MIIFTTIVEVWKSENNSIPHYATTSNNVVYEKMYIKAPPSHDRSLSLFHLQETMSSRIAMVAVFGNMAVHAVLETTSGLYERSSL